MGDVEFTEGIGSQLNHARNNLKALIINLEHRGSYKHESDLLEWSVKYTQEDIKDRIVEWEVIDSTGYSIDPPFIESISDQPYTPNEGPIIPFQNIRKNNKTNTKRIQSFIQWSKNSELGSSNLFTNFSKINFLLIGNIKKKPKISVKNPGIIKSKAAKAIAAPDIIS